MKKIITTTGKFFARFFIAIFCILFLFTTVTLAWSGVQMTKGQIMDSLPVTPDNFTPTVRFVVFTDSHNRNTRVADMFETIYALYDNDETYPGVDAVFGLGDFTSIGEEKDYDAFIQILDEYAREDTQVINILGNHEVKNKDAVTLFESKFGYEINTVHEINGFRFICLSSYPHITEWTYPVSSLTWAAEQLKIAEENADGKPVFVMQHPHNFGTVYGSTIWCSPQTNPIWAGHENVVVFSGHSHYPMNDPRSINQTTYTNVGIGGMAYFELDDNYLVGQHPANYDTAAQFAVVEANDNGSVRILEYDLNSKTFFNDYFIEDVNDTSTFAYTYKNLKAMDEAPVFDADTKVTAAKAQDGSWILTFKEASDRFIVHDYKIVITDKNGKKVFHDNIVNDYYYIDGDAETHINIGNVLSENEVYDIQITAVNAYHRKSEIFRQTFSA